MAVAPIIVSGSWDDRLAQAQRLVDNYDASAVPTLRSIIDRLSRFSPAQLAAGGFHLYLVRQRAANLLENYHLSKGELAQATDVRREILSWNEGYDEDERPEHERLLVMLALQERYDEALTYSHRLIEQGADASENLTAIVGAALRCGDAHLADEILVELERDANRERNADLSRKKRVNLAQCRSQLCLLRHQWAEATAWFEHACALDPAERDGSAILYDAMVRYGEAERALALIDQDAKHPLRAALWRGLALRSLGKEDAGRAVWSNSLTVDLSKFASNPGIFEWILCHYYLGEPASIGYALSLQVIRADSDTIWFAHCIAGLGAAMRNEIAGALLQMNVGLEKMRVDLAGVHFDEEVRFHFTHLLAPEQMTPLLHYFRTPRPLPIEPTTHESATSNAD